MREGELTYDDFLRRLNIQDVLIDAGYHLNRRDGLRYPSYVRLDSEGRRIRNDKFIVTQQGKCCFKPQQQKSYNIISFIKEHPHFFAEYRAGVSSDRLVNLVCNRLLNQPVADRDTRIIQPKREVKPFDMADYDIHQFNPQDRATQKKFYPFFKHRGIDLYTQYAFHRNFCLATKHREDGMKYTNLAFPLTVPKDTGQVVGLEERGRPRMDGSGSYKGKAEGSNSSQGLWIASPAQTPLANARHIYWFESAYDAMAYYQLHQVNNKDLRKAVFVSTGGNPTVEQMRGVLALTLPARSISVLIPTLRESSLPRICNRRCTGLSAPPSSRRRSGRHIWIPSLTARISMKATLNCCPTLCGRVTANMNPRGKKPCRCGRAVCATRTTYGSRRIS